MGGRLVELASVSAICPKGLRFETRCLDNFLKKEGVDLINLLCCHYESWAPSTINPKLTLSLILMRDQHGKVCISVVLWLKLAQTYTNSKKWTLNTTHIFDDSRANRDMPLFWGPTASLHGQQCRRKHREMIKKLTGWAILPHSQKKLLCKWAFRSNWTLLYPSVTVTQFM
jgi:hypothetical protein